VVFGISIGLGYPHDKIFQSNNPTSPGGQPADWEWKTGALMTSQTKTGWTVNTRYRNPVCRASHRRRSLAIRNMGFVLSVAVFWLGISVEVAVGNSNAIFGQLADSIGDRRSEGLEIMAEWHPPMLSDQTEADLILYGRVQSGRHIYSIRSQGEYGPEPTRLFIEGLSLEPVSELMESDPSIKYDGAFEVPLRVHQNDFQIRRRFRLGNPIQPGLYPVNGYLRFQICSDKLCSLPLIKPFTSEITVTTAP
jgi:hypothetical protein